MAPDKRKPPGGLGRLSLSVLADGFDTERDNPKALRKQASTLGLIPIGLVADRIAQRLARRGEVRHAS